MNDELKKILQNPSSLSREGQYIVTGELALQAEPPAIIEKLPLTERIRLYAWLANSQNPDVKDISPETYRAIVSAVGNTIDFKLSETADAAIQAIFGRTELREKQNIPEVNKNEFDGFQNNSERSRQLHLAYVLTSFLPGALQKTSDDFISTDLNETEQGILLALLKIKRADTHTTVEAALNTVSKNIKLTPTVWNSFQATCLDLEKNPESFASKTMSIIDRFVTREIRRLNPQDITKMDDLRAFRYFQALGWGGLVTPLFRDTQLYFYQNLSPSNTIKRIREQQIDKAVEHFFTLPGDQIQEWQNTKNTWSEKPKSEKTDPLANYAAILGGILETPLIPQVGVASWNEAPDKPKSVSNGYYVGWQDIKAAGEEKPKNVFSNKVFLIDDVDGSNRPLSLRRTFRSATSTATHEILHSDNEQIVSRYWDNKVKNYQALFEEGKKPSEIQFNDPLGPTAGILSYSTVGRTPYVSPETGYDLHRHQPVEKYVWSFQNQFTAALNGTLVYRQVDSGERVLKQELKSLFDKVGQVLVARKELTGDASDIVPLKIYNPSQHPFGTLTMRDGEAVNSVAAENGDNYIYADFSKFDGRMSALGYMQTNLDKLSLNNHDELEANTTFLKQAADFLIQIPDEIWAIRKKLGTSEQALGEKLEKLAISAQELGEDLSDYSFIVIRRKEIEARRSEETVQAAQRQQVITNLAAIL